MTNPCDNCGADLRVCKDCEIYNDYIAIPKDATNGDMIMAMFRNFKFNEEWKATRHFELQSEQGHIEITGIATSDWWNTLYKGADHD